MLNMHILHFLINEHNFSILFYFTYQQKFFLTTCFENKTGILPESELGYCLRLKA